jgi:hypothetical protein
MPRRASRRRVVSGSGDESLDPLGNLIANAAEGGCALCERAFDRGGILETPVEALRLRRENRTALPRVVTNRDDVAERPADELVDGLGALASARSEDGFVPALKMSKRSPAARRSRPSAI